MTEKKQHRLISPSGFLFLSLILFVSGPVSAWEYDEFSVDLEGRIAMMATAGKWNPYVEVRGVYHGSEGAFRYNSYTVGSYYRAAPWLKVGAFYRLQGGARHLEDWIVVATPESQSWNDVTGRYENLIYLDATPRFLLPWMPGENWVAPVKVRYSYNFRNNDQSLLLRPGLTYVVMSEREPVVSLNLNYNFYFALNFNDVPLYAHGPYFSVIGHLSEWFKLEGRVNYLMKTYQKTEFGGPWILHSKHLIIGLGVIFTPDLSSGK